MEERLKKYNEKKAEIKRLKYKIIKLENEEYNANTASYEVTGIKPKGYMQSGAENKVVKNMDKIRQYKNQIAELEAEIEFIDTALNTLKPADRRIVELRYKVGLEIKSIMSDTGYSKGGLEKCLRKSIEKLDKFEKVSKK